jgi:oligopeptide/dipeptide ABC transporter ATP-binding protein
MRNELSWLQAQLYNTANAYTPWDNGAISGPGVTFDVKLLDMMMEGFYIGQVYTPSNIGDPDKYFAPLSPDQMVLGVPSGTNSAGSGVLAPSDYIQILNLMMDLKDKMRLTYIFITHDLSVVKHISDDILVLYLGKMAEKAASDRLFENPLHPYTKALLTAIPIPDISYKGKEAEVMKGEVISPVSPPDYCRFAPRCPLATKKCLSIAPEFVEVEDNHFVACHLV